MVGNAFELLPLPGRGAAVAAGAGANLGAGGGFAGCNGGGLLRSRGGPRALCRGGSSMSAGSPALLRYFLGLCAAPGPAGGCCWDTCFFQPGGLHAAGLAAPFGSAAGRALAPSCAAGALSAVTKAGTNRFLLRAAAFRLHAGGGGRGAAGCGACAPAGMTGRCSGNRRYEKSGKSSEPVQSCGNALGPAAATG